MLNIIRKKFYGGLFYLTLSLILVEGIRVTCWGMDPAILGAEEFRRLATQYAREPHQRNSPLIDLEPESPAVRRLYEHITRSCQEVIDRAQDPLQLEGRNPIGDERRLYRVTTGSTAAIPQRNNHVRNFLSPDFNLVYPAFAHFTPDHPQFDPRRNPPTFPLDKEFDIATLGQPLVFMRIHQLNNERELTRFGGLYGAPLEQLLRQGTTTVADYNDRYAIAKRWGPKNYFSFIVLPAGQEIIYYHGRCSAQSADHFSRIDTTHGGGTQIFLAKADTIYRVGPVPISENIYVEPDMAEWTEEQEAAYRIIGPNSSSDRHQLDFLEMTDRVFNLGELRDGLAALVNPA